MSRHLSYASFSSSQFILAGMRRGQAQLSDCFALVVQRRREATKLSRAALAEKAGLHQTYIGLLERGERAPSLDTAQAIASALGLPLSQMLIEAERLCARKINSRGD